MSKSNPKRKGLFSQTLALAQTIGQNGRQLLQHKAPDSVTSMTDQPAAHQVLEGTAQRIHPLQTQSAYAHPQVFMQQQLPQLSQQLLGRHYQRVQHISSFIAPELNEKIANYVFEQLNHAVSQLSSTAALLKEVGAKDLDELAQDPARAARISQALANQNKIYAALIGALTGVSGVVGAAIDIPSSVALALRSIYQTGRAYGFELHDEDQVVVEYIFKHIDLGCILEKQTLLAALRALSSTLQTHDLQQLQKILGSENDVELLKRWLTNDAGELKWQWLNRMPQFNQLSKVLGFANMGVGALYSLKLLEQATTQAQLVFAQARDYINQYPECAEHGPLYAYEQAVQQSQVAPTLSSAPQQHQAEQEPQTADVKTAASTAQKSAASAAQAFEADDNATITTAAEQTQQHTSQSQQVISRNAAEQHTTTKSVTDSGVEKEAIHHNQVSKRAKKMVHKSAHKK